ncbi:MAG: fructose-bisphosphatase class III [Candidatus Izimaplasma sp.]|nr:fructose-bisphosphatase class III [Candidatus Izimaplasma bacterium]
MKYFVISDIHAHYDALVNSLNKYEFNRNDEFHHLLILGDLFDRGKHSKQVLEYVYQLYKDNKATILLGNHDGFLLDFLKGDDSQVMFNAYYNGFDETLYSLSGIKLMSNNMTEIRESINKRYPYLLDWLESFPLYLEIDDYIFVHGGIDGSVKNWKKLLTRRDLTWSYEFELPPVPGKTVVAGHTRIPTIKYKNVNYHKLFKKKPKAFDILYLDNKILIDRFVEVTNELNVLILELDK